MKTTILILLATVALAFGEDWRTAPGADITWPSRLTDAIAGFSVRKDRYNEAHWRDPANGYHVFRIIECDAIVTVWLTRDSHIIDTTPSIERSLNLSTAHGIRIGHRP